MIAMQKRKVEMKMDNQLLLLDSYNIFYLLFNLSIRNSTHNFELWVVCLLYFKYIFYYIMYIIVNFLN